MGQFPFRRLQVQLAEMINGLPADSRLPSEPHLARQLGVSRATLREAMRAFEGQGMIRRRQGVGTFVIGKVPVLESGLEILESIETIAHRIGLSVKTSDLQVEQIKADEDLTRILSVPFQSSLTRVSRVIFTDSRPVAFLVDILPEEFLSPADLEADFNGSVLDLLLLRGSPKLSTSRTDIRAISATSEVARALQIQRDDVLLQFIASLYTDTGKVVDYSFSYFLPGYFHFHVVRRVG